MPGEAKGRGQRPQPKQKNAAQPHNMATPEDLRRVVANGFCQLQNAKFISPKRKAIDAYEAYVAGHGDLYVSTTDEKATLAAEYASDLK